MTKRLCTILSGLLLAGCCETSLKENTIPYSLSANDFKVKNDTTAKTLEYVFLNNPYELGDEDQILIKFEDQTIHSGLFEAAGKLQIPQDMIGQRLRPTLIVNDNSEYYQFPVLTTFFLSDDAKILYFVFTPSNERTEGFYVIPASENIY